MRGQAPSGKVNLPQRSLGYWVTHQRAQELSFDRQRQIFHWTPACEQAFDKLKGLLVSAAILVFPDFSKSSWIQMQVHQGLELCCPSGVMMAQSTSSPMGVVP